MKHYMRFWVGLLALGTLFTCSDLEKTQNDPPPPPQTVEATFVKFDPSSGNPADIAVPNDILRNPFTGQNAVPLQGEPFDSFNSLFGFSTSSPIIIPFDGLLDASTVNNDTILVIDLADLAAAQQGADVNPKRTMAFQVVNDTVTGNATVAIIPALPLKPGRPHAVIITQGVLGDPSGEPVASQTLTLLLKQSQPFVDENGKSTRGALGDEQAQALEPLRQAYQQIWAAAEGATGQSRDDIPFSFVFTTQPLHQTLMAMRNRLQSETPTPQVGIAMVGAAAVDGLYQQLGLAAAPHDAIGAVYGGVYSSPNFMSNPYQGGFIGSGADVQEISRHEMKFWAAMPPGDGPFPVILFGHGLGSQKEAMFAFANTACAAGFGIIAIDFPLHGERAGDVINNETGGPGPDGVIDPSGTGFINPGLPRTMRDNFRQTILDYIVLTKMCTSGATDFDGNGVPNFIPQATTYLGQSGGGILGAGLMPLEPALQLGVLNVPGGRFFSLFQFSNEVTPIINAGLAAQGIEPGTPEYTLFFLVMATVLDDVDPFNLSHHMISGDLNGGTASYPLIQEMIGDAVVPNISTEDLARTIGMPQINPVIVPITGLPAVDAPFQGYGIFQFENGDHAFLLRPEEPNTAAGQLQAITYLGSGLQGAPTIIDPFAAPKMEFEIPYRPYFEAPKWENLVWFGNPISAWK